MRARVFRAYLPSRTHHGPIQSVGCVSVSLLLVSLACSAKQDARKREIQESEQRAEELQGRIQVVERRTQELIETQEKGRR